MESESRDGAISGDREGVPKPDSHSIGISRKSISEHELNGGPVLPSLPRISFSGWARWMSAWHVGVAFVHQGTTMIANHDLPPEFLDSLSSFTLRRPRNGLRRWFPLSLLIGAPNEARTGELYPWTLFAHGVSTAWSPG
jgi:hypothetical protein